MASRSLPFGSPHGTPLSAYRQRQSQPNFNTVSSVEKIRTLLNKSANESIAEEASPNVLRTSTINQQVMDFPIHVDAELLSNYLTEVANSAMRELEEVWDEVGFHNPEDRSRLIAEILVDFKSLCGKKIQVERNVADQFRASIASAKEELRDLSRALKCDIDPALLEENVGLNLTDELQTLETHLETVRAAAHAVSTDLIEYRERLLAMHQSLGTELEPRWMDVESDLTNSRRESFQQHLNEMQHVVNNRTSSIIQLLVDCKSLIAELSIDVSSAQGQMEDILDKQIMESLVENSNDGKELSTLWLEKVGISSASLKHLTTRISELNSEKRKRKQRLGELGEEIALLWEKLHITEEEQRSFTVSVKGLGMDTITKGEAEVGRLRKMKKERMGALVKEARDTITSLWNETNMDDFQRNSFQEFYVQEDDYYTDNLLQHHDDYIQILQARLEQMRPILSIIRKREEILQERHEYEELQKNPDRLKQRGAALTRQLMIEEKMNRRIKKDLPKYTDVLVRKLNAWSKENNEPFLYSGEEYVNVIRRQEGKWRDYKDREMQMRLQKKQKERTTDIMLSHGGFSTGQRSKSRARSNSRGRTALSNVQSRENSLASAGSNQSHGSGKSRDRKGEGRNDRFESKASRTRPSSRVRGGVL